MKIELIQGALNSAIDSQILEGEVMFHSDREVQYASGHYQKTLANQGIKCLMRRKGNCWDNAVVESFLTH